jgi:hypothetical protein
MAQLLDESSQALGGAGYDLGSLIDSSAHVARDLRPVAEQTRRLVEDTAPLLDTQVQTADSIRLWARSLAGVTTQVTADDPQIRQILRQGPGAAREVTRLFDQIKPTLPVLLANLTSIGQVGVTYHGSLEQLLVLLPPLTSYFIGAGQWNNYLGLGMGDFRISLGDPQPCTAGYLPPNQWRPPSDTSPIDTPTGLYCKLPQDSPLAVRGARNYPCVGHPGKRAPTVEICNSDKPYEPIAQRQHSLGPYPFDPNLVSQGAPPDWRVGQNEHIYGPLEGTPPPPGPGGEPGAAPPVDSPPGPPTPDGSASVNDAPGADAIAPPPNAVPPPDPTETPPPPEIAADTPAVQPQASNILSPNGFGQGTPLAFARYDPASGKYMAPDGQVYQQRDLTPAGHAQTWKQLVLPG